MIDLLGCFPLTYKNKIFSYRSERFCTPTKPHTSPLSTNIANHTTWLSAGVMEVVENEVGGGGSSISGPSKLDTPNAATSSVHCTTISVNSYASRYEGEARHARLHFIAMRSSNLQEDALKALLRSLKKSGNTHMYEEVSRKVGAALGPDWEFDKSWYDSTQAAMQLRLEKAESDIAVAKSRNVKESMRMGFMEVGRIHTERGNLQAALKAYFASREHHTNAQHNTDMCLQVAIASIALGQYRQAATYVSKIENLEDCTLRSKVRAIAGLNALQEGQYKTAARSFLDVEAAAAGSGNFPGGILSTEDVAIYGSMCALATFTRPDLRRLVLECKTFKPMLDLVPDFKDLVTAFVQSSYGACLQHLEMLKPQLLLDLHLHKFADELCTLISDRVLIQYFTPYQSVSLNIMAEAFGKDVPSLEIALAQLISKGHLPARIDSQAKTMHRRGIDERHETVNKVKHLAKMHTSEIRRGILRLSLLQNGFVVSSKTSGGAVRGAQFGGGVRGGEGGGGGMDVDPERGVDDGDSDHSDG